MRTVSTRAAAGRCKEVQKELPERSDYLEACYDFYRFKADGIEWASNLDAVLRAAANDTLHQGSESADGASRRRNLKGCHRIVLPGTMGPVRTPPRPGDHARPRNRKRRDCRNTAAADRTARNDCNVLWTSGESGRMDPGAERAAGEGEDDGRCMGVLPLVRNRRRPGRLRDSQPAARLRVLYPLPGNDRTKRMRKRGLHGMRQHLADGSLRQPG